jgi:hypothetical protein
MPLPTTRCARGRDGKRIPFSRRVLFAPAVCLTANDSSRHCEEPWRRSNPDFIFALDCFAFARNDKRKETERRETHFHLSAPYGCGTAPAGAVSRPAGRARLSAFHRGSRWGVVISQLSSRPGFLGRGGRTILLTANRGEDRNVLRGRYPRPTCPSPVSTSRTGRSTGAHDARSRPRAGYKPARRRRTRPNLRVCLPETSLRARFDSRRNVTKVEKIVNEKETSIFR